MLNSSFWKKIFLKFFILFVMIWILLVMYPNPWRLATGLNRIMNPHTDPAAVASLAQTMPSDPALIEQEVYKLIPYSYDWDTYGMPWYCPSVKEALEKGEGDCKAQALVFASILDYKGIPNHINWSTRHVWVDYPAKVATGLEENALYQKNTETGKKSFDLPTTPPGDVFYELYNDFIATMPGSRMFLMLFGLAGLTGLRVINTRKGEISQKSRIIYTLLALFFGVLGAHRFYSGQTKTAIAMLSMSIIGTVTAWFIVGVPIIIAISAWVLFDLVNALAGSARDKQGRVIKNWAWSVQAQSATV
jgi:TM2 domain-containing membrane protein YozV